MVRVFVAAIFAAGCVGASASAGVTVFDFESLAHGEIITNQFEPALSIGVVNPNRSFDIASGFDTTLMGTLDPDLEGPPWSGGNLAAGNTVLGKVLVISQTQTDSNNDGILDNPNDEGNRPAGTLTLGFAQAVSLFGFDVVDIEGIVQEFSMLEFFLGNMKVGEVGFNEFTNPMSAYFDASIVFGDNSANRVSPITAAQLGSTFDRVVIHVGGSSGWDNFVIPSPGAAGLLALSGLVAARRRRGLA